MSTRSTRRLTGAAVLALTALSLTPAVGSAATAPAPVSAADAAGGYIARQLAVTGSHFVTYASPDWGLTADGILALDAVGVGQAQATASTADLSTHVKDYITGEQWGDKGSLYAGATAKTLNVAVAQKADPRAFGGVDLVADLTSLLQPSGRFSDRSSYGDYSNAFGQSLAIIGLTRSTGSAPTSAVTFLKAQQCPDGGFRLDPATTSCTSDPDATSMAVQAIIAANGSSDAAAVRGLGFLAGKLGADGGLGGGTPTTAENANSAGLAGQAFLAGGRTAAARKVQAYVAKLQYGCAFPATVRGGIAYDQAAYSRQLALGAKAVPTDQDRRSTTQASLVLAGSDLLTVTSTGAAAGTTAMTCTRTATARTTSPTPSSPTSSPTAVPAADLPFTGTNLFPLLGLGALLVVLGAGAMALSRRQGAHR